MRLKDQVAIVTGGASGIGKALSIRFAEVGARVVVADRAEEQAKRIADQIQGLAVACDVAIEADIQNLVAQTEAHFGPIDLFCSNAGISFGEPASVTSAGNAEWQTCWEIHVMAHMYAARAVLPGMIERGGGYFLQMVSAAGLLNQIGDAAYSTTKHAAVGFAEALAITHGDEGIQVSVICPQYVATPMLGYEEGEDFGGYPGILGPEQVADSVIKGLEEERFLILPHPQVEKFHRHKATDYDRWIRGMRRLRSNIIDQTGATNLASMHKLV